MLGATIVTRLRSWLQGKYIGEDQYGNRYYCSRRQKDAFGREKRWVIFKGFVDASKVPAEWHGWLHHTHLQPFSQRKPYAWEKAHMPNATGTVQAYRPTGLHLNLTAQEPPKKDYQPWMPS